jgi:hypothetical protein
MIKFGNFCKNWCFGAYFMHNNIKIGTYLFTNTRMEKQQQYYFLVTRQVRL